MNPAKLLSLIKGQLLSWLNLDVVDPKSSDMQPDREKWITVLPLMQLSDPKEMRLIGSQLDRYTTLHHTIVNYENTRYFYLPPAPAVGGRAWPGMFGEFSRIRPCSSEALRWYIERDQNAVVGSLSVTGYLH
jgi:hypothetical protein